MPEEVVDEKETVHSTKTSPSEADVAAALKMDKGSDAVLVSWSTKEVAKKGDNYISAIAGVQVEYVQAGQKGKTSYVVKMKQNWSSEGTCELNRLVYGKEGGVYTQLIPLLNRTLAEAEIGALQVPRCPHSSWGDEDRQLFLEDLRIRGFTAHGRKRGLDVKHTHLVLSELAKLHASSILLQSRSPDSDLADRFRFLTWEWWNFSDIPTNTFRSVITGGLLTASKLARKLGNEEVGDWFEELAPRGIEVLREQVERTPPFDAVLHGDCWINNFLFRYDSEGQPQELMLLDLQFCRKAPVAADLSYFLYTSLEGDVRNKHLSQFLSTYYEALKSFLAAGGEDVPFSLEELKVDFNRRKPVGLIFGALLMPGLVSSDDEVQELDVASQEAAKNYVEVKRQNSLSMLDKNPLLGPRLLDLYVDVMDYMSQK